MRRLESQGENVPFKDDGQHLVACDSQSTDNMKLHDTYLGMLILMQHGLITQLGGNSLEASWQLTGGGSIY